jgi:hypothetical protein
MHFEFLVEDQSGMAMLERLLPKMIAPEHTVEIHSYKGIGRIPKNLSPHAAPDKRILLDQLPRLIAGYGRAFSAYPKHYKAMVVVVCDLDDRNFDQFTKELNNLKSGVQPAPDAEFCIAVEEIEAWFLGDHSAITKAYPKAKQAILNTYKNDSICGTWEVLADAVYPGGATALKAQGFQIVGREKSLWAEKITGHMDLSANRSPSFRRFVQTITASIADWN